MLVLEGGADDRRRHALRGAHASRASCTTSARPSIRWWPGSPFLRTLPLGEHGLELAAPGRRARAPARRRHGGGARALARRDGRVDRRRRRTRLPTADGAARARRRAGCCPQLLGPLRPPRHPVPLARFGLSALRSATGLARGALPRRARAARCSRAAPRTRCCRLEQPATAAVRPGARAARPRGRLADRARRLAAIADALARTCARSAARSAPDSPVESLDELPAARAVLLDLDAAAGAAGGRRRGCPTATGARSARYRYGPGRLQARLGARRADPLDGPGVPPRRARCTWAARSTRSPPPSARWPRAGSRAAVRAGGAADASSTRAARRRASTTAWAYCHVPARLGARHDRAHRGAGRALRARLPRPGARPRSAMGPARRSSATTRTTSAATSTAARQDLRQLFARPVARPSRTRPRRAASTSARRPRRPAAACTACAATTPRGPRCGARSSRPRQAHRAAGEAVHERARVARRSTRRRWRRSIPPARACRPTARRPTSAPLSRATARSSFGLMELSG